jgi:5-methylcytosine-specific restriction endonuclease McrA
MKAIPKAVVVQLIKTHGILCQNCNKQEFEHIHHIDNDHSNNDFSNLMLLCVTCHM